MRTLIVGAGEVGKALYQVVSKSHETFLKDVEDLELEKVEILHICYPDHKDFAKTTRNYVEKYKPSLTIINSSVSVGTTDTCGLNVVYSPVRGRHPKLATDLLIYEKFVFGTDVNDIQIAVRHFNECGMKSQGIKGFFNSGELLKLISNIHMGLEIAWRQEVERILTKFLVRPEIYEMWEESYREGYLQSGDNHLVRPSMKPDPIGGHCILPCTEILRSQYPSKVLDFILESNENAKSKT